MNCGGIVMIAWGGLWVEAAVLLQDDLDLFSVMDSQMSQWMTQRLQPSRTVKR